MHSNDTIATYLQTCDVEPITASRLVCLTPPTNLGEDDIGVYHLYIGFQMDGVERYMNVSTVLPGQGRLQLYGNPTIGNVDDIIDITPGSYLDIKVIDVYYKLNHSITKETYTIFY